MTHASSMLCHAKQESLTIEANLEPGMPSARFLFCCCAINRIALEGKKLSILGDVKIMPTRCSPSAAACTRIRESVRC